MDIFIIRHGETEFNKLGIVQGSGVDTDLNHNGRLQAEAFYRQYGDHDFDLLVTSALRRTHQTAQQFIDKGIPWMERPDINEICWGEHEGLPSTPDSIECFKKTIRAWKSGDYHAAIPEGESAHQLGARLQGFIDWLHTRPAEKLLVVSHGRTMRALVTMMKGNPLSDMESVRHSNTGCYQMRLVDGVFEVVKENDISHLQGTAVLQF